MNKQTQTNKTTLIGCGEALIDLIGEKGENAKLTAHPGGGVANMCAAAAKLGANTYFMGGFGGDRMAELLKEALGGAGVRDAAYIDLKDSQTALALVSIADDGNRSFAFYRNKTADLSISADDIDHAIVGMGDAWHRARCLHASSVAMSAEPGRSAQIHTMKRAKEAGIAVAFDPNVRLNLWDSEEALRDVVREVLPLVDILKISEEEVPFVLGSPLKDVSHTIEELGELLAKLRAYGELPIVLITRGPRGAVLYVGDNAFEHKGYPIPAKDTTGAGDAAMGALLSRIVCKLDEEGVEATSESLISYLKRCDGSFLEGLVDWVNLVATYSTQHHGGIASYGSEAEILSFFAKLAL